MYLATGEFNSPDGEHCTSFYTCWDPIEIDGESYLYFYIDMSDDFAPWEAKGRVNNIRVDFQNIDYTTPGLNQFDVCFVGVFRDLEDAEGYVYDYLGVEKPVDTEESSTEEATTVASEGATSTPEGTTVAPEGTTAAPEGTTAASEGTTAAPADNDDQRRGGCGSVVGFGAIVMVATVGAVGFVTFKKKED